MKSSKQKVLESIDAIMKNSKGDTTKDAKKEEEFGMLLSRKLQMFMLNLHVMLPKIL